MICRSTYSAAERQRRSTVAVSSEKKDERQSPQAPPPTRMRSLTLGWKSFVEKILEKPEER